MNNRQFSKYTPFLALVFGGVLLLLQWRLFATGVDKNGLLIPGNVYDRLLVVGTAVFFGILFLLTLREKGFAGVSCPTAAVMIAMVIGAAGVGLLSWESYQQAQDLMGSVVAGIGIVCSVAMLAGAFLPRITQVGALATGLFFAVHSVLRYRMNSADPQIQDYVLPLLAEIVLMLSFYHYAVAGREEDNPRLRNLWRCCAIMLCVAAVLRGGAAFLLLLPYLLIVRGDETR